MDLNKWSGQRHTIGREKESDPDLHSDPGAEGLGPCALHFIASSAIHPINLGRLFIQAPKAPHRFPGFFNQVSNLTRHGSILPKRRHCGDDQKRAPPSNAIR
jgi:hypothetical protein